jgi:hypothetical protein
MTYTKPEITSLASASFAIQGSPKAYDYMHIDSTKEVNLITVPAYECDE